MKHITFNDKSLKNNRRLPFFLALEEWVARKLPPGNYFFSWQVDPTVICGRNQEIDKEVNLRYCHDNGIDVVRRRSGGGCVFADRQNFMFSFITCSDKVTEVFASYTEMIANALRQLGLKAESTGRNDITIEGKKVSGNAFYHLPGRSIAHGTMLYDFNPEALSKALTPSAAKLKSKGVKSVPSRVTSLSREGIELTPEEFERFMIEKITDREPYYLNETDIKEVEEIEKRYYFPSFLRLESQKNNLFKDGFTHFSKKTLLSGLGEFCADFDVSQENNTIHNISLTGDFFMSGDIESIISSGINGQFFNKENIKEALRKMRIHEVIPGFTENDFLHLIFDSEENND